MERKFERGSAAAPRQHQDEQIDVGYEPVLGSDAPAVGTIQEWNLHRSLSRHPAISQIVPDQDTVHCYHNTR